jgi:hypothetical protein
MEYDTLLAYLISVHIYYKHFLEPTLIHHVSAVKLNALPAGRKAYKDLL